ncbi:hypothetical protein V6N13_013126 [Hibiscus sabdariffa]|uniref:Uncharacterized protein n=1 Tax=Hibiscus sabdariffa TaxID=183260 RepID=A0ABR2SH95_9ROSI
MADVQMADAETFTFQAEMNQLLSLIINIFTVTRRFSLASLSAMPLMYVYYVSVTAFRKHVCLKASGKIRFGSLTDKSKLDAHLELFIRLLL